MIYNQQVFFALVKAGLWEQEVRLSSFGDIDFSAIMQLAKEQTVVGVVTAGLEKVADSRVLRPNVLQFVGSTLQIEKKNLAMNQLVAELVNRLQKSNIYAILVKGQGVAQCYERPLWRSSGDIDLLLNTEDYENVKNLLIPLADFVDVEDIKRKHLPIKIQGIVVELHGSMPFVLSKQVDDVIDKIIKDCIEHHSTRIWRLKDIDILLPNPDNDIILVFTHFLHHFFIEGVGLRQICDWCRLLWTYKNEIDKTLLEARLRKMGLMTEWKVFASLAVNTLAMPQEAMPFYSPNTRWRRKAQRILDRIMKCGNMGHNNDVSYRRKQSVYIANIITFFRRFMDFAELTWVFPIDSPRFFMTYVYKRIKK